MAGASYVPAMMSTVDWVSRTTMSLFQHETQGSGRHCHLTSLSGRGRG
jgi:hypothetical protein